MTGSFSRPSNAITHGSGRDSFNPSGKSPRGRKNYIRRPSVSRMGLVSAAHENDLLRQAVGIVAVVAIIMVLSDEPFLSHVPLVVVLTGFLLLDVVVDAYDLPDATKGFVWGGLLVVLGGVEIAFVDETLWLVVFALVAGLWVLADARKSYRDGPVQHRIGSYFAELDDAGADEAMYRIEIAGRVVRAVRERPRPADELADDLGLTVEHTRDVLDAASGQGLVRERDGVYYPNESRFGKAEPFMRFARWLPRRLARPFR